MSGLHNPAVRQTVMQLEKSQIRHLKTLAHARKPIVMVGQRGLTENVIQELENALKRHELVKVKVNVGDRDLRDASIKRLCEDTGAIAIQRIGNIAVLFRRNQRQPVIVFPA